MTNREIIAGYELAGYELCRQCPFKQDLPKCINEPCKIGICKWLDMQVKEREQEVDEKR